jgi:signal transduction histidine kinase
VARDEGQARPRAPVSALFEDREGNIWTGDSLGIERLRDSAFVTYSVADGLPSDSNGPVYVDSEQRTWFAPLEGGLYWLKNGRIGSVTDAGLGHDVIYSIAGNEGELWVGRQQGGLTRLRYKGSSVTANTYRESDGLVQNSVYAVGQSRDGTVWAGTLSGGVSEFRNGHFTNYTTANGMLSNTVTSIAETADGTMWFATPNGLNALSSGQWRGFTTSDGLPSADVYCLMADSSGVLWIGSAAGLAFLTSDRVQVPHQLPDSLHEQIFGIAEDNKGWLWIATSNHVLRIKRSALLEGRFSDSDLREYTLDDGLHGLEGVKRHRSVLADSVGRIWFSMNRGISVVDPNRATARSEPALVHVEAISADGNPIDPRSRVRISTARQRVTLSYVGLSLSNPERVRYRYRLDGFDKDWSEPVSVRTAIYTNLSPGSYLFRVIASSSDGLWKGSEATFPFDIEPMWWQTWWFRLCAVLGTGVVILAFYRLRMRQLARQMQTRLEERLEERERIARDLHDTLLQGFFSAAMQLDVVNDRLPADAPAKPVLLRVIELMRQVGEEGRNAVRSLRVSPRESYDLEQAFSQIREELPGQEDVAYSVTAEGVRRPLNLVVWDEVYRLGREAVINAFRHSRADNIEVKVEYAGRNLRVIVRDDGCGIGPQVLETGREGHWGLSGMRERAEKIGAKLTVLSRPDAGTEVELSIPGSVAFESVSSNRLSQWFTRWLGRKEKRIVQQPDNGADE